VTEREAALHAFLAASGWADATLVSLPGDASTRRYHRAMRGGRKAMVMDQPQAAETPAAGPDASPDERRRLGYNAVARLAGADCARFVAVARFLRAQGLSAPDIQACDPAQGFVLMEDLGDDLYTDVLDRGESEPQIYRAAIEVIARLHAASAPCHLDPGTPLFAYDETALLAETDLLTEWFVPLALGRAAQPDETAEHRALWRTALAGRPGTLPVFVHRDYHAQNLLWLPGRSGTARVGVIDFQDAVAGSAGYDIVSLIEDARRDVAPELGEAMTLHYLRAMDAQDIAVDEAAPRAEMALAAAQRNAKIAGIFARLSRRDGKARYLGYLPRVWNYLDRDLQHPALAALRAWYDRMIPRERRGSIEEFAA
jgi:aminoglycoside/choline kinase family phosphotransferase